MSQANSSPALASRSFLGGERRNIPSYPRHLTADERATVFEKTERDLQARLLAVPENSNKAAQLGVVTKLAATLLVQDLWLLDRVEALEAQLHGRDARP